MDGTSLWTDDGFGHTRGSTTVEFDHRTNEAAVIGTIITQAEKRGPSRCLPATYDQVCWLRLVTVECE